MEYNRRRRREYQGQGGGGGGPFIIKGREITTVQAVAWSGNRTLLQPGETPFPPSLSVLQLSRSVGRSASEQWNGRTPMPALTQLISFLSGAKSEREEWAPNLSHSLFVALSQLFERAGKVQGMLVLVGVGGRHSL